MEFKAPTIEQLLEAGVHFGHQKRRWHPSMQKYIYGVMGKSHIIDLYKTQEHLEKAMEALYEIACKNEQILILGTKRQARSVIIRNATEWGVLTVTERWLGGTFTNYDSIKQNLQELARLEKGFETGAFDKYTKKEKLMLQRRKENLEKLYSGIKGLKQKIGAIVIVDPKKEKTAVREANKNKVPVFALTDTNTNPEGIDYIIPANDDALKSIELLLVTIGETIKLGYDQGKINKAQQEAEKKKAVEQKAETKKEPVKKPAVKKEEKAKPAKAKTAEVKETKKATKTEDLKEETKSAKKPVVKIEEEELKNDEEFKKEAKAAKKVVKKTIIKADTEDKEEDKPVKAKAKPKEKTTANKATKK